MTDNSRYNDAKDYFYKLVDSIDEKNLNIFLSILRHFDNGK